MIVAVLYAVYRLLSFLIGALAVLPTTIAAALVTGSITIIGSVVAVALGRYLEKTKEVQAARNTVLQLLMSEHPQPCVKPDRKSECELESLIHTLDVPKAAD